MTTIHVFCGTTKRSHTSGVVASIITLYSQTHNYVSILEEAPAASTGANCVADCAGVSNGDYQSCVGCHVYATCSNGRKYDNRPCPANLVWDDNVK